MAGDSFFEPDEDEVEDTTTEQESTDVPVEQESEDDDLFAELDTDLEDEPEQEEQESTEEEEPAAAAPVPTSLDLLTQQVTELAQMQAARLRQEQQPAPTQAPPAWVDPFDREENKARLAELEGPAMFDLDKFRELRQFERDLQAERSQHQLDVQLSQQMGKLNGLSQLNTVRDQHLVEIRKNGAAYVDKSAYDSATEEFIKDVLNGDRAQYAELFAGSEQVRRQIANNAKVHAFEARQKKTAAPAAKPKPAPRSAARPSGAVSAPAPGTRTKIPLSERLLDADQQEEFSKNWFFSDKKKKGGS